MLQLGIRIVAYSPLGRGQLTGNMTAAVDVLVPLRRLDKYQRDNLEHNLRLVDAVGNIWDKHSGYPMATFALSWIRQVTDRDGLGVFFPSIASSKADSVRVNAQNIEVSDDDVASINHVLKENTTKRESGYRDKRIILRVSGPDELQ